jgi:hypothetical protein
MAYTSDFYKGVHHVYRKERLDEIEMFDCIQKLSGFQMTSFYRPDDFIPINRPPKKTLRPTTEAELEIFINNTLDKLRNLIISTTGSGFHAPVLVIHLSSFVGPVQLTMLSKKILGSRENFRYLISEIIYVRNGSYMINV